jgi:putative ATPase
MHTPGGFLCGEVASAFQKAIRRGHEREALFWASELDLGGFGGYVWKRLRIIASEDVGLADTETVIAVRSLYENWSESKRTKDVGAMPLFLAHAVLLVVRAKKNAIAVHAVFAFWMGDRAAMGMEIPDHALDLFTRRGRSMGRRGAAGKEFFATESGKLENKAPIPDPYEDEWLDAWKDSDG